MQLRRLVRSDATALRELMLQAYAEAPLSFNSSTEERAAKPLSWWENRLSVSTTIDGMVFGAFLKDTLIGSVTIDFNSQRKLAHKASLGGMYISSGFRRQGYAKALVSLAIAHCKELPSLQKLQLATDRENHAAITLYQACGFSQYGIEPRAVIHDGRAADHLLMQMRLSEGL